tara:strand:- start:12732 stop:12833 length:102 start_codon:yes stop_codon:yes gene_type:complete
MDDQIHEKLTEADADLVTGRVSEWNSDQIKSIA